MKEASALEPGHSDMAARLGGSDDLNFTETG